MSAQSISSPELQEDRINSICTLGGNPGLVGGRKEGGGARAVTLRWPKERKEGLKREEGTWECCCWSDSPGGSKGAPWNQGCPSWAWAASLRAFSFCWRWRGPRRRGQNWGCSAACCVPGRHPPASRCCSTCGHLPTETPRPSGAYSCYRVALRLTRGSRLFRAS